MHASEYKLKDFYRKETWFFTPFTRNISRKELLSKKYSCWDTPWLIAYSPVLTISVEW